MHLVGFVKVLNFVYSLSSDCTNIGRTNLKNIGKSKNAMKEILHKSWKYITQ